MQLYVFVHNIPNNKASTVKMEAFKFGAKFAIV